MVNFHVECKRVPKIDDPLLVIGLGGTGTDALLHIMRKFKDRFILPKINDKTQDRPERTAYLAVDTDLHHLSSAGLGDIRFNPSDKLELSIPKMDELIRNPAAMAAWEKTWWDKTIPAFKAGDGAGGFRQVGRLLLFRNANKIVDKLKNTISTLMAVEREGVSGSLTVVMTTGIGGGTGSGVFLDMAYLIRYVLQQYYHGISVKIMSFFIMPDVNLSHMQSPTDALTRNLKKNAFAALKELDFWMNWDQHKYSFNQVYTTGIEYLWDSQPINDVVLLSEGRADGTVIKDAYKVVMDVLAESLLNFFAAEQNTSTDGTFSYRSHAVNVAAQAINMHKAFPVNYAYMSVGAASSEAQQDNMVVYEAKVTFDKVMELKNNPPILGTRLADAILEEVLPKDEDLFVQFDAVCPLPPYFHNEPGYDPPTILNMQGDEAIHCQPYRAFAHDTEMSVREFTEAKAGLVYQRFTAMVRKYLTDPAYGPFAVLEMLRDPQNGFAAKIHTFVSWWTTQKDNADNAAANQMGFVTNTLFPDMVNLNSLEKMMKMYGKVKRYIEGCERLYMDKRDSFLSKHMAKELQAIETKIVDYCNVILPTFCELLEKVSRDLALDVEDLIRTQRSSGGGANIINFNGLKAYIDQQMGAMSAAGKMNQTTVHILQKLADASFEVKLDRVGQLEEWEHQREQFLNSADSFINTLGEEINGVTMDQILNMTMPNTTDQQKIDYMVEHLMPDLRNAAQTMLKLTASQDGMVEYSYVSVPDDAKIVRAGLAEYSKQNHITPKYSKINDRIYWLNTYNCLPMYRYANLPDLEKNYEDSLRSNSAMGLHLVQAAEDNPELRNDWSILPSPLPHLLLGLPPSERLRGQTEKASAMVDEALNTKFAALTIQATGVNLSVRIKRTPEGSFMVAETLKQNADAIKDDPKLTDEEKISSLEKLRDDGEPVLVRCGNYAPAFANALNLIIVTKDGTAAEKERAEAAIYKASLEAAKYTLTTQHPDLLEQMDKQLAMFRYIGQVMEPIRARLAEQQETENFVKLFMHMFLFDYFAWNRLSIEFKDVRGQMSKLVSTNMLTDTEISLYAYCKPLVLMRILSKEDSRIDSNDRRYLLDKAKKLMADIELLPDEEYKAAQEKAKEFRATYNNTPNEISFSRGDLSRAIREQNAALMTAMLRETRVFLT